MTYTLRPYQEEALERLRDNIRRGIRNQILCIPTGGGKTLIATHMIRECLNKGKRALFIADRTVLVDQTSAVLDEHGIDHGVIMADHWRWAPYHRVQVASAQTLARRTWPEADLIINDEAHTQHATVLRRIARRDVVCIGLSATPTVRGLGKYYDAVVSVTTTHKLIEDGHLVPYRIYSASAPDMTGVPVVAGEFEEKETVRRVMPIVGDCVAEYLKHGGDRKFIAFAVNTDHARELQRQFMAAGVMTQLFTYRETPAERDEIMKEFRGPDSYIRGLISVSALSRGLDVPDIGVVILARPLRKSVAELVQSIGRGLRPAPGKRDCIVLDHAGNTDPDRLWGPLMDIYEYGVQELDDGSRKKATRKVERPVPEPRKCPKCAHVHRARPTCPSCGFEYPRPPRIVHAPGELFERTVAMSSAERREVHAQLLWLARARGKKDGWAYYLTKERTGAYPTGPLPEPKPPSPELERWVTSQLIRWAKSQKRNAAGPRPARYAVQSR